MTEQTLTPWDELSPEQQLRLREAYGHYLDGQPPTCSMETKIERFRTWLATEGVSYEQGPPLRRR